MASFFLLHMTNLANNYFHWVQYEAKMRHLITSCSNFVQLGLARKSTAFYFWCAISYLHKVSFVQFVYISSFYRPPYRHWAGMAAIKVITTRGTARASCAINHKAELTRDLGEVLWRNGRIFVINKTSARHPISRHTTDLKRHSCFGKVAFSHFYVDHCGSVSNQTIQL